MKRAFTLIELLIVVAIIAILAAIAVPNFLEAQTRSKVTRVKADLRSLATAIEAYAVDSNKPPREYSSSAYNDPLINGQSVAGLLGPWLSTPIAYISNPWIIDPFPLEHATIPPDEQRFTYHDLNDRADGGTGPSFTPAFAQAALNFYGAWRLGSIGPDRNYAHGFLNSAQMCYDPTNGTISLGNIWRSQARTESEQPPVGPLINAH
jgi:prepilin-type N-terminal cleavage/methylation domain-containing protein